jgi:glycerophosphoryl diester phosphodiesterase
MPAAWARCPAELAGIGLLDETGAPVAGETVPSLRQLLDVIDARVPLLIEVKSRAGADRAAVPCGEPLPRRLSRAGWGDEFRPARDRLVRPLFAPCGARPGDDRGRAPDLAGPPKRHLALWRARPQFLAYDIADIANPVVRLARRRGVPVLTWTVRTPEDARGLPPMPMRRLPKGRCCWPRHAVRLATPWR